MAICKDLGRPHDVYQQKLSRLDRMPQAQTGRGALTRVGGDSGGRAARPLGGALGRVQIHVVVPGLRLNFFKKSVYICRAFAEYKGIISV